MEATRTSGRRQPGRPTYDPVGNPVEIGPAWWGNSNILVLGIPGVIWEPCTAEDTSRFTYDAAYQLINEQRDGANAYNTTYVHDPVGNRLQKIESGQVTSYLYNAADEQILVTPPTGQPTTISYDANGNTLVEDTGGALTTYVWDDENRLVGITEPDASLHTFAYAADGLRRKKETPTETRHFVWDGVNVLQEVDAALQRVAQYTDYPGEWGGLVSQRRGSTSSFYGFDLQANARVLVSVGGVVTDSYSYKAFGEELAVSGSSENPLRFGAQVGYWRDLADRLYVRARVPRPSWGRWLSRTWLEYLLEGEHPYTYAADNPLVYLDPTGLLVPGADKLAQAPGGLGVLGKVLLAIETIILTLGDQSPAGDPACSTRRPGCRALGHPYRDWLSTATVFAAWQKTLSEQYDKERGSLWVMQGPIDPSNVGNPAQVCSKAAWFTHEVAKEKMNRELIERGYKGMNLGYPVNYGIGMAESGPCSARTLPGKPHAMGMHATINLTAEHRKGKGRAVLSPWDLYCCPTCMDTVKGSLLSCLCTIEERGREKQGSFGRHRRLWSFEYFFLHTVPGHLRKP